MAVNLFTGATDNNWGTSTNWSLGAVPTATDGNVATFDATSPNCTVNTSIRVCNGIDFTGYTNTITMSFDIRINGACTLDPSMNVSGSGTIVFNGTTNTLQSNGKVWSNSFETTSNVTGAGGVSVTLLDNCVFNGSLIVGSTISSVSATINGFSLTFGGGLSVFGNGNRTLGGTTNLIANGTGNFTTGVNSWVSNPLEINTTGTITFLTRFYKRSGLFKYTAGTTQTNGCSFVFGSISLTVDINGDTSASATTLSTTGINLYSLDTTSAVTTTLSSPLRVTNLHTAGGGNFNASASIYNKGSYTINSNTGSGLYNYYLDGTGTWSGSSSVRHNLTINTSGTITISGNVSFSGNTSAVFTYVSGTVNSSSGTLLLGQLTNAKLDLNSLVLTNVLCNGNATTTLLSTLNCTNLSFSTSHTFDGSYGFVCANFTSSVTSNIVTLKNGVTYTVNSALSLSNSTLKSSTVSSYAYFNVNPVASVSCTNNTVTDINSSGGQTVVSTASTLTRTINWSLTANTGNFLLIFD